MYDDIYTVPSGIVLQTGNFKNVLAFAAGSCDKLRNRVQEIGYNETDVLAFLRDINACVSPATGNDVLYKKPETEIHVYAYVGGIDVGAGYEVTGRLIAKFTLPSTDKRTALNIGVNFMRNYKTKTYHYFYSGLSSVITAKSNVANNMISVPITIEYDFATGKIRPYFDGGICFNRNNQSGQLDQYLNPLPTSTSNGFSFVAALGVDYMASTNLLIKAEWREEYLLHYPTIGVAYTF